MSKKNQMKKPSIDSPHLIERSILPIHDKPYSGPLYYDAKDPEAKFEPIQPIRPPKDAPNIMIILIDDVGFGASSAFGGPCHTPNAERLAKEGLKFNRFHTTALCSPTRAALLTGRNHHSVGMGGITEMATPSAGQTSMIPNNAAVIAKTLKYNGYSTAHFGKCHEVPVWENSSIGPFDHWPLGQGFEKFYGFIGGESSQWYPEIYDGITKIELPDDPNYHFMHDMTDKALDWIKAQKSLARDKPFFLYFAPGATHAPHHVPQEWADKYKGKFDEGWDKLRETIFLQQKKLGVIPQDSKLTARPEAISSWENMPEDLKPVLRRQMEVYAGFLEYTDYHVGRLLDACSRTGILDNTLVYYIIGDNGASAEGTINGTFNEMINFNGAANLETPEFLMSHIDDLGAQNSYNHYSVGWAHAMCTPFQWTKQVASHWGGTRNGAIVHWPKGFKSKNEIRSQFCHVIDVVPTILEAAGIPHPTLVEGVQQKPIEGVSMVYAFDDEKAEERHQTQYFEMFGNRGIYHKGWTAVTKHSTPWILSGALPPFDEDVWELYDTTKDWTQAEDVAKKHPEKLKELQRLWLMEAQRFNVLPLDDRRMERLIPEMVGRPTLVHGDSQLLFEGMAISEQSVVNIKNKSHSLTAEIVVPDVEVKGTIMAQGTNFGGWALYAKDGKLKYCYNYLGLQTYFIETSELLTPGLHQVRMEFAYDGGGLGKGGNVTLFVDGKDCGKGRIEHTHATIFSADSNATVGNKTGAPISSDFVKSQNRFNGKVNWVEIKIGLENFDHLISQEEKMRIAMSIQ
jgi:arylsulfatase A-like enzyme